MAEIARVPGELKEKRKLKSTVHSWYKTISRRWSFVSNDHGEPLGDILLGFLLLILGGRWRHFDQLSDRKTPTTAKA